MTRLIRAGGACDYRWRGGGFASLNVSPIRLSGLSTNYCLLVKTVAYALGCFNTLLLLFCINRDLKKKKEKEGGKTQSNLDYP